MNMPSKILYVMMLNNVLSYKVLLSKQILWSVYETLDIN